MKIEEVSFFQNKPFIEAFRRSAYGDKLAKASDDFDPVAHHFFLYDDANEVVGMVRLLRSDETPLFEQNTETQLKNPVLPAGKKSCECSRLCTKQGGSGTYFLRLFKFLADYAAAHRIDYCLTCISEKYLPLYKKLGAKIYGAGFQPENFSDLHYLVMFPTDEITALLATIPVAAR